MNERRSILRLVSWLQRARPAPRLLLRAMVAGTLAELTGLALFVGAPYLLLFSASHHRLVAGSTLAILLIIIELLAFARSPLRFGERIAAHDLGLYSVTTWRHWLTVTVGSWPYSRWSAASTGDLLERALGDTDVLQDLWLRCLVPLGSIAVGTLTADVALAFWNSPSINAPVAAASLILTQLLFLSALVAQFNSMDRDERLVRQARSARTAARVELPAAAPELTLLGAHEILASRVASHSAHVERREARRDRRDVVNSLLIVAGPLVAVGLLSLFARHGRHLAGRDAVVVLLLAVATIELLFVARQALAVAVAVATSADRLDELQYPAPLTEASWPANGLLDVEPLYWQHGNHVVLDGLTITVAPGRHVAITGPNGAGKSTLLRLLARLEETPRSTVTLGGVELLAIDEISLRRHLAYVAADPGLLTGVVDQVVRVGRPTADDPVTALRELGIEVTSSDRFEHLSRGEAQRVALVRGLLDEPSIVLLDEPTSGLGPVESHQLLVWLAKREATLIIATHDPLVVQWCEDVYELENGQLRLINR